MLRPLLAAGRRVQLEERGHRRDAPHFPGAILPHLQLPETAAASDLSQHGNYVSAPHHSTRQGQICSLFSSFPAFKVLYKKHLGSVPCLLPKLEGVGALGCRGLCCSPLPGALLHSTGTCALSGLYASNLNINEGFRPGPFASVTSNTELLPGSA